MSLTSQLKTPGSPLDVWLRKHLPDVEALRQLYLSRLPSGMSAARGWPRGGGPVPWPVLGTAADLRLRLALVRDLELDPPRQGAWIVEQNCPGSPDLSGVFDRLAEVVAELAPERRDQPVLLPREGEERLLRLCVVMAWLEGVYRAGIPADPDPVVDGPFRRGEPAPEVDELLAAVPDGALLDLAFVLRRADQTGMGGLRSGSTERQVKVGPVFTLSGAVGGADADWLCEGTLIDCKTTVRPERLKDSDLYQLAGYPLLDTPDDLGIRRVGFYLARQGVVVRFRLSEVLSELAGSPVESFDQLTELRRDLAEHLTRRRPRAGKPRPAASR